MSNHNVQVIQQIYEAFGRGDLPAILDRVRDDTSWGFNGARPTIVPWHKTAIGKGGVSEFIHTLGASLDISAFEPAEFIADGDTVIARIHIAYTVKSTKHTVDEEQLHLWKLDSGGKVAHMLHFEDTHEVVEACRV